MKMRAKYLILAVALLCLLALPATALAADGGNSTSKIDDSVTAAIQAAGGHEAVPVLVYTNPGDASVVADAVPDGVATTDMKPLDAVAATLMPSEIDQLAQDDSVDLIVADDPVFGLDYSSSMDITNLSIGLNKVPSPASGGPDGAGVGVAVVDTGVSTSSDLGSSRIIGWKDFINGRTQPYDDAGHGTFVAGLIAGDGTASLPLDQGGTATVQFRGVAPQANIIGIKVLDSTGQGQASDVMAGILWAVAHKAQYNIRVLNLSIGGDPVAPTAFDPIAQAAEYAWRHGITVVCAAGNEGAMGPGGITSPGDDPYVITVGALDTQQTATTSDDTVCSYSSEGPTLWDEIAKPDLVAPGNRLISIRVPGSYIDTTFPQNTIPVSSYAPTAPSTTQSGYLMLSGTSTSSPVVAGAAALMISADPSLSPDDVKVRLMGSADPLPRTSRLEQGAGELDVPGALEDHALARGYALSQDIGNGMTILTKDSYAAWDVLGWKKFAATKYGWTNHAWTKYAAAKYAWTKYAWTKYAWTKYAWTKYAWTKYAWTKYAWTKYAWTKYAWTDYSAAKYAWTKYAWTTLIEGQ